MTTRRRKRKNPPTYLKAILGFTGAVITGLVPAAQTGHLTVASVIIALGLAVGTGSAVYKFPNGEG